MRAYIVSYYAAGRRIASDCDGDFFATREAAEQAGASLVSSAKASREADGNNVWNWPVRFTVRQTTI